MKKYIALFLCMITVFSLCACNVYEKLFPALTSPEPTSPEADAPSETTTEPTETTPEPEETTPQGTPNEKDEPQGELIEVDPFGYYYALLDAYRTAIRRFDFLVDSDDQTIVRELELEDLDQAEHIRRIMQAADAFYPYNDRGAENTSPQRLTYFGYDQKDLNNDGTKELIFLTESFQVIAIYTEVQRLHSIRNEKFWVEESALLDTFDPSRECWIDSEGRIHVNGNNTGFCKYHAVYEINEGGEGLKQLIEYGEDFTWYANHDHLYKVIDGKKVEITQEEFDLLDAQYGKYLTPSERGKATREQSGLNMYPLYSVWDDELKEAMYRSALNGEEEVYVQKTGKYTCLKDFLLSDGTSLAKCETLRYMYYDLDDDDLYDVILDCGNDKLCLTYMCGKVVLKTLSDEEWGEIPYYYNDEYCTLGAPWRERLLTLEEIETIASSVWHIRDGDGDGACGTFYLYYIVVSEEPDEDGYHLVTWLAEVYGHCGDDACTETDPNHMHLRRVEDNRYMLVHQRTGEVLDDCRFSLEGAKRLAAKYWGFEDGSVIHGMGKTFVIRIEVTDDFGFYDALYNAYLLVECYSTLDYEQGGKPHEIKKLDFVHIGKKDGGTYVYPYVEAK